MMIILVINMLSKTIIIDMMIALVIPNQVHKVKPHLVATFL